MTDVETKEPNETDSENGSQGVAVWAGGKSNKATFTCSDKNQPGECDGWDNFTLLHQRLKT